MIYTVKIFPGMDRLSSVITTMRDWGVDDSWFQLRSGQTKEYHIDMCYIAKHGVLRS